MDHVVRTVDPAEWFALKELRLAALRDPLAPLAFLESYEDAAAKLDVFWMQRAARGAEDGTGTRQFVSEAPDGKLSGTATVLVEEPGTTDFFGDVVEQRQGHVVGVYVRPEHRGNGLIQALLDAALDWSWTVSGMARVRLFVHERNVRAQGAYRKSGFAPTGRTVLFAPDPESRELEMAVQRPRSA
jgi:RimJ/RimL family protein N-acetyltransferase